MGERRTEQAIAVGIGVTVILFLISGSIAFALAAGIASGVGLRTALSPNRESGLDTGSGRQDALESDPLVNFVPDGAQPIALAESEAWANILKGGSDTNVWVRRRLIASDHPEAVVDAFRVEADRLGWTPTSDSTSAHLRLRRAAGPTTDLVTVSHEDNFVSIVATVVDQTRRPSGRHSARRATVLLPAEVLAPSGSGGLSIGVKYAALARSRA